MLRDRSLWGLLHPDVLAGECHLPLRFHDPEHKLLGVSMKITQISHRIWRSDRLIWAGVPLGEKDDRAGLDGVGILVFA